ncbi:MAG: flavodoxin family protein [Coprobacillaceae bacterium]
MKVLLVNGSPKEKGCTYTALEEVAITLQADGIETEIFWIGKKPIIGCTACRACVKLGKCVYGDDRVNEFVALANEVDGFIFGTPVHYAAASGAITSFMDRVFYSAMQSDKEPFYLKPAATIVSARRAGTIATFDQINKYFTISQMPIISSQYWNMVHGNKPEDVKKDEEGMQIMRVLAHNMAYFIQCKKIAMENGVTLPKVEKSVQTNFISD